MSAAALGGQRGRGGRGGHQWSISSTASTLALWVCAIASLLAAPAHATQHLVGAGASWSDIAARVRPGDEIILMPGKHVGATLDELQGTREQPITIRGLTLNQPSVIEAQQHGIRLRRPQHVIIRDLAITGATVAGIAVSGEEASPAARRVAPQEPPPPKDGSEPPWRADVTIRNITVEKTGPHGRRNAIQVDGVSHVLIERVRIEGWGGSAVKIAGSSDVRLQHSIMRGRGDHGQLSGVQIRGGSENVRVTHCFFVDAGEAAVVLGAVTAPSSSNSASDPAYEPRRVTIERNVIRRGEAAFAFLSADQCTVRNNTVLDPKRFAYFIAPPGHLRQTTFGANIIVWKSNGPEGLAHVQQPAKADGLTVEQNLWWSGGAPSDIAALGEPLGNVRSPQVMDLDPDLDEHFKPRNRRAQMFGTEGP